MTRLRKLPSRRCTFCFHALPPVALACALVGTVACGGGGGASGRVPPAKPAAEPPQESTQGVPERVPAPAIHADRLVSVGWTPSAALAAVRRGSAPTYAFAGTYSSKDTRAVDGQAYYALGSITKVFTGILLADAVERGEVTLDDTLAKLAPALRMPERAERRITLRHLVTHRSGLPRLPQDLGAKADPNDPYAAYGKDKLWAVLKKTKIDHPPGTEFEYSNFAMAVLGAVLEKRLGAPYETLVRTRVLEPLGLDGVTFDPPAAQVPPAHAGGQEVPHWHMAAHTPAGALYATAPGLAKFAAVVLDPPDNAAGRAVRRSLTVLEEAADGAPRLGHAWHYDGDVAWHNGGTGGASAMLVVDGPRGVATVALANAAMAGPLTALGLALHLEATGQPSTFQVEPPTGNMNRPVASVSKEQLARVVGRYQLAENFFLDVFIEGGQVFVRATGQQQIPFFPASEDTFFLRVVEAEGRFLFGAPGAPATAVVWSQGGQKVEAPRVAPAE